jgi:hypothetical protein
MSAAIDETARQRRLDGYRVVDTLPEAAYDDIARLAAEVCDAPMALVSLIDRDRQWFKARQGLDTAQTPRDIAFCDHAIREPTKIMEVRDAATDERFRANPLVTGKPDIRFYAGVPLVTPDGAAIGTVCVLDNEPRSLTDAQRAGLASLARLTMTLLEARRREQDGERDAALAEAQAAETPPVSVAPGSIMPPPPAPPAKRTVVLFELQDFAGAVRRMGERAVEREMQALVQALEAKIAAGAGDSINRVTGSNELIAVIHGDDVFTALQSLHDQASEFERQTSLQVLSAFAEAASPEERLDETFLRASEALSALKDTRTRSS